MRSLFFALLSALTAVVPVPPDAELRVDPLRHKGYVEPSRGGPV